MKLKFLKDEINARPIDDFLGLSPNQIHLLLYYPFEDFEHILTFDSSFDEALLKDVPVVDKTTLLIKLIGGAGEVKATKNGNLPLKIVNALYDNPFPDTRHTAPSEDYALDVLALRLTVMRLGWIKKRNQRYSLTRKGQQIFDEGFTPHHYIILLQYWLRRYNWSFTDGYRGCQIVQAAALFSLWVLHRKAREHLAIKSFIDAFIRGFPMAVEEAIPIEFANITATDELSSVIDLRFIERFAQYFGLIECTADENFFSWERIEKAQIRITPLFDAALRWFPPEKQKVVLNVPPTSVLQ